MKTKEIVIGAMLTAFSILIPFAFGNYLRILIPPFSATLASHVPVMIAMMISPAVAIIVGVGSGLGFLLAYGAGPVGLMISARAFSHAIWAYTGAVMIRRGQSFGKAIAVTAVMHALLEALVVYLMFIVFGIPVTQGSGVDVYKRQRQDGVSGLRRLRRRVLLLQQIRFVLGRQLLQNVPGHKFCYNLR